MSQTISRLEERLGVAVFERTTRTVRLTEAGERLYGSVRPALEELRTATEEVKELGNEPSGTLRLNVSSAAESFLRAHVLCGFLAAYPRVRLEVIVTEHTGEIVEAGYDAAVGLGEMIHHDMMTIPVSEELRLSVVGATSYFEQHPPPRHPRELVGHALINWRPAAEAPAYRWEFAEDGRDFSLTVDARVVTTNPVLNIRLAVAGVGLTIAFDRSVRRYVEAGELVPVLEDYCPPFPGFHLYYPRRRNRSAALRALVDYVRHQFVE